MIRVLIADDHPSVRMGLCRALEDAKDIEVIGQTSDGEKTIALAKKLKPDVAVIDVAMPKLSGIEVAKQIKESCPQTKIIVLSAYNYRAYIRDAIQAGAVGYLLKDSPLHHLVEAVRMVHEGEAVVSLKENGDVLGYLASNNGNSRKLGTKELRDRELQVLKLAAKGLSTKNIAKELDIGTRTVQSHLNAIFFKLDTSSRTEAVLRALKLGWITPEDLP